MSSTNKNMNKGRNRSKNKIKLHGFNNLTKTLSFNMYDICYAKSVKDRNAYIAYIDEQYNAERLTDILEHVTRIIGARILNIAKQDYNPLGSSVTFMIAEEVAEVSKAPRRAEQTESPGPVPEAQSPGNTSETASAGSVTKTASPGPLSEAVVAHLDKSHITVHTYPEYHPQGGVATFRADIDVATCGQISPLKALNYLIQSFDADIMTIDYRVRGFTRQITGEKIFIDHKISSIQNFIPSHIKANYQMMDVNIYQENIFHTKCILREFNLDNYLFGYSQSDLDADTVSKITRKIMREMDEIYNGRNLP